MPRKLPCWISAFKEYTQLLRTNDTFREWGAIWAVSAACERRVKFYTDTPNPLYLNQFIMLIAPPGIGKSQVVDFVKRMIKGSTALTECFQTGPDSVTRAGMQEYLKGAYRTYSVKGKMYECTPIHCLSSEFGNLVPAHDLSYLNFLNVLWDCPDAYMDKTISRGEVNMKSPYVNMLTASQPKFLAETLPKTAFGMGWASRTLMIYAAKNDDAQRAIFGARKADKNLYANLVHDLQLITQLIGECVFDEEAQKLLEQWHVNGQEPVPKHPKMQDYNPRRLIHLLKMCCIYSVSRRDTLIVGKQDVLDAMNVLFEAEALMPQIHSEMATTDNHEIIEDTLHFITQTFLKTNTPVHEAIILEYLGRRLPISQLSYALNHLIATKMIVDTTNSINEGNRMFKPGSSRYNR